MSDRVGVVGAGATGARPREMVALALALTASAFVVWAGLGMLRDTLDSWDLGLGPTPYWLPGHALQLYLVTPAVAFATSLLLLGPGLILSAVFGREKGAAAWLVSGLAISLLVHIAVTTAFEFATGITAKGTGYLMLVAAMNIGCLAVAGVRLSAGARSRLALEGQGGDLIAGAILFWLCLVLFAPKFYWENFSGDGSGSLQFARLYIAELWPFWTPEAGPIRNAPGLTMVLFVIPESWFVRLWGEWEFSVRAPLLMYLALLYPVLAQLIRTGRNHAVIAISDATLIVGALLLYVLANVYSGGYHIYFGDSPMPAARETLSLICFLGYALFFIEDRRWLMLATGVMTHLVIPTGGLWLLMWPAAVFLTFRPIPWARLIVAAGIVGVAGFISVILPKIIVGVGLPFPGDEFGADNIVTRLRFVTFADWGRFAFWAVPAGILPALFLLTWPKQDRIARALTLAALGYFLFFYFQAYRVLLHHFIPAMIPPLVIMYRSELWTRHQPALRIAAAVLIFVSVWLSWPRQMKMHGFERVIGQHVVTEGPIFESAERGDGDRFRGFDEKALDIAHILLGNLFKTTYGEDDPKERFFGAPLVWWYYSEFPKPEGQVINYVLKPLDEATELDGTLFDQKDGYGLFIRDMGLYEDHAGTKLPVDTGAAIYVTPRTVIFGHGAKRGERFVFDIVPPIKRLLGMNQN
ncbi:hypothetical protein DEA8626_01620 [Defluviimonas aquaemixtae]|uniref:Glycosyltransferase RgtA/B/C/D-like domain-containing protein n=1 Tax=Albidovulum aquaemixtae TaxID=1542388 RepID=A0A2R8B6D6_9RHOB|nr:hypothetical protein [Defluviimonas aquaemixtae]SPH18090.1 hypothetical protein DEA8626_01620 [Defluviimonas aquaemixtae]